MDSKKAKRQLYKKQWIANKRAKNIGQPAAKLSVIDSSLEEDQLASTLQVPKI
jgi:hypothetical protein